MNPVVEAAPRVWRGLPVAALPLRLHAAKGSAAGADPDPAIEERQAWQRAFDEGAQEGREEGLRRGYEEGLRRGIAEAAARSEQLLQRAVTEAVAPLEAQRAQLAVLARALEDAQHDALALAEEEIVALGYEALCRILGSEALAPEVVVAHVRHLVSQRCGSPCLAVHLHPDDAALLLSDAQPPPSEPAWVPDPEVALGGCVLRARAGGLDLQLETALQACKAALLRTREERSRAGAPRSLP